MSLAIIFSRAQAGVDAPLVTVEVHLSNGLPALAIVGLPEVAVKESKERVRAALLNANFEFPARRITINLAPADLPKEGGRYDLPIALGILVASGQLPPAACVQHEFIGELALTGELRGIRGVLPAAIQAAHAGRALIVPAVNAAEGALVSAASIHAANHLLEICGHLSGRHLLQRTPCPPLLNPAGSAEDIADIRGQHHAKRALEIAAAGAHSLLMIGPPGTGKTMLANRLPGILPPLTEQEALESAAIASISSGGFNFHRWHERPFRRPHHTASGIALVGGGGTPQPGEISLAHNGVLFLDELPEFDRHVLEVLREPLESGHIVISRAARQSEFPARFQLIAAMNPCPCGYQGDPSGRCRCTAEQISRYRARVSGPLLDRIDMHLEVAPVPRAALRRAPEGSIPTSAQVRERVTQARQRQLARDGKPAHHLTPKEIEVSCSIDAHMTALLEKTTTQLGLSARAYHRILKVARTIADLAGAENIDRMHLGEAIGYRMLDRRSME